MDKLKKQKNTKILSVSKKLTAALLISTVIIAICIIAFNYMYQRKYIHDYFITQGENAANMVTAIVDGDRIMDYWNLGEDDEEYITALSRLRILQTSNRIDDLYIVRPAPEGVYYVFDTNHTDSAHNLGDFVLWSTSLEPYIDKFLSGQEIEPLQFHSNDLDALSIVKPIFSNDNRLAAYICVEYSMKDMRQELSRFLYIIIAVLAGITCIAVLFFLLLIRRIILQPIDILADYADDFMLCLKDGDEEINGIHTRFDELKIHSNDEFELLETALHSMRDRMNQYIHNLGIEKQRADTDPMTGLFNRGAFKQCAESVMYTGMVDRQTHAFIMVDMDHFKQVNDIYGHHAGDEMIKAVADILTAEFRSGDCVARMGGDEFAIFCRNTSDTAMLHKKAQSICDKVRNLTLEDGNKPISASIGIALSIGERPLTYQQLYENADAALYMSKENGRDGYTFFDE